MRAIYLSYPNSRNRFPDLTVAKPAIFRNVTFFSGRLRVALWNP
jgi:hypothetical protein